MIRRPPRSTRCPYTPLFRSRRMPEELNRVLVDHAAHLLLCPSESAIANLRAERAAGKLEDRKSTRLNSSHANISYAVFCLKKKKRRLPVQPSNGRTHS